MKGFKKSVSVLLACMLLFTLFFPGCGQKQDDVSTVTSNEPASTVKSGETNKPDTTKEAVKKDGVKKKIVVVQEGSEDFRVAQEKNALEALSKGGYTQENSEIIEIKIAANEKEGADVVKRINESKPDLVIVCVGSFAIKTVIQPLLGSGIPILTSSGAEGFVDLNNLPKQNVIGIKTMPDGLQKNAFAYLEKISPLNGKKAVFISMEGRFKRETVVENFKAVLNTELKDFVEVKYQEDYKAAVEKYNKDEEVGWILVGIWPISKKDGSPGNSLEIAKWDRENNKKPSVTYWEGAVQLGIPVGLGVDIPALGMQLGEIAVTMLNGEKIQNIKVQEPRKINIVLNQKRAQELNLVFPSDILGGASKVFTDYEGHFRQAN